MIALLIILWLILSTIVSIQYAPACKDLDFTNTAIIIIIFIIGGPILAAADVLETVIDCILPEGWDDDIGSSRY